MGDRRCDPGYLVGDAHPTQMSSLSFKLPDCVSFQIRDWLPPGTGLDAEPRLLRKIVPLPARVDEVYL